MNTDKAFINCRAGSLIPPPVVADFQIGDGPSSMGTSTATLEPKGGVSDPARQFHPCPSV